MSPGEQAEPAAMAEMCIMDAEDRRTTAKDRFALNSCPIACSVMNHDRRLLHSTDIEGLWCPR